MINVIVTGINSCVSCRRCAMSDATGVERCRATVEDRCKFIKTV